MNGIPTPKNSIANAIKIYLFPSIVSILAMMIWRDVTELRNDVKQLLAQSNIDKTRIEQLEKSVQMLNHQVFKTPMTATNTKYPGSQDPVSNLVLNHDRYFREEDVFDVKKYIPKV